MKDSLNRAGETASEVIERGRDRMPSFLVDLIDRLRSAQVLFHGAGLAFYGLISVAPFMVVGFWIVGAIVGEDRVEDLAGNLAEMAPGEVDVEPAIENLLEVGTGVGFIALLTALWPATAYGSGLVRAFDEISPADDRSAAGFRGRAKTLALLVAMPVLLLGALLVSYLLTGLVDGGFAVLAAMWMAAAVVGAAVTAAGIAGIYLLFGPDELSWRAFAIGAGIASFAISVTSAGYLVYLEQGADWEERVAGSGLATVVLLALWLYLTNVILLAGYAVALQWDERQNGGKDASEERTDDACGEGPGGQCDQHNQGTSPSA